MSSPARASWLADLQRLAVEFCESAVLIDGAPDRPWNPEQVLWAGRNAPGPADRVLAYMPFGDGRERVAVLGEDSRSCFSRFVDRFRCDHACGEAYGVAFLRDMLVGLLQLSLPGATIEQVASPYWKRYVASALKEIEAGSSERYGEAVVSALQALPAPHPPTVVVLPLAGVSALSAQGIGGVTILPAASCAADPDIGGCAMFHRRLKELRQRRDEGSLVFAKLTASAEPGRAVELAVCRTDQVCRLLRLLPNPGLADGPLTDPPRIDLDAEDSAAFYIAATSVGTHPIPVRRTTSDPQGKLRHWRVEPLLEDRTWRRLAAIVEGGAGCDIEARVLAGLRHLGDAMAEPGPAAAAFLAATAVEALLGVPGEICGEATPSGGIVARCGNGSEAAGAEGELQQLAELAARLLADRPDERAAYRERAIEVGRLRRQLVHDLDRPVLPGERAVAVWLAYAVLKRLLQHEELRGYADLLELRGP